MSSRVPVYEIGHFKRLVYRRVRNALIRNAVFVAFCIYALISVFLDRRTEETPIVLASYAVYGLFFSWRLAVAVRRKKDLKLHPFFKTLARYGDPFAVANKLEEGVASGNALTENGMILTNHFLLKKDTFPDVLALEDIAWVYRKVTNSSINFIPTGSIGSIEIFAFLEPYRRAPLKNIGDNPQIFSELIKRAPRARFGFTPENEAWWKEESGKRR